MAPSRRPRKRRRRAEADSATAEIVKISQPVYNMPAYEITSAEGVELLHEKSLEVLSDVGIDFYDEEARAILRQHGG